MTLAGFRRAMATGALVAGLAVLAMFFFNLRGTGPVQAGVAQPGTEADPLVTRGYVDSYLEDRYNTILVKVDVLTSQVAVLEKQVAELKEKIKPRIILVLGKKTAYVGNQPRTLDVAPFQDNNRTMLPFRFIGEALGAEIGWDQDSQTVSYRLGGNNLNLTIGSKLAVSNGAAIELDTAPRLVQGYTVVPVRVIAELLGAKVDWNEKTMTVTITP